jgi:hypothetical protein
MKKSFESREALASYVSALLLTSDLESGCQLTIAMKPDGSGACSVIPATIGYSAISSKTTKIKQEDS